MKLLSTLAVMGAMRELALVYRRRTGIEIEAEFAPTVGLLERIRAGESGDIGILTARGIDDLIVDGTMLTGSRTDIALSFVGIAVRAGTPKPDISSVEALRSALLGRAVRRFFENRGQRHLLRGIAGPTGPCGLGQYACRAVGVHR